MKIAHIAPPWITIPPKNYGGSEIVIYNLVEEQVALGHDVTLFAPGDAKTSAKQVSFYPKALVEEGIPWVAHLKAFYHLYKSLGYVRDFDIVHTHLSSSADMYIFPLTAHLDTPHVTTLHSRFPFDRARNWVGEADKYYMEWAPSVPIVAISERAMEEVPYDLDFVGVVHHGIPMQKFRPVKVKRGDFFVWLGRFMPEKGPHLAIKYIGPVNMRQKISLLSRARGFLNPILWEEPFGMVMIEAMALGCPVISFPRGAAPEIVVHRKTGFLVHDVNEMVKFFPRIDGIDRNVTREHVEKNFSARAMAEKYIKVYKKVIKKKKEAAVRRYEIKTDKPLITPPPVPDFVKKAVSVQVPHRTTQAAMVKVEVEPKP